MDVIVLIQGEKWWQESEEPWQTLAACFEIAKALKSPNPAEYVSHFPIHQDGSCNGLQHYAALGRDQQGAESVNLYPAEKPQDVYSAIAALVLANLPLNSFRISLRFLDFSYNRSLFNPCRLKGREKQTLITACR